MAQEYSFFNANLVNGTYDRIYNASDWAEYFATFLGNGIAHKPEGCLEVQAGTGMEVIISPGSAFVNGYRYENTTPLTISINPSNSSYGRITNIVIELNLSNRNIQILTVDGVSQPSPVSLPLVQNEGVYQLCIAQVYVSAACTQITQANIKDTRADKELCGFIKGLFGTNENSVVKRDIETLNNEVSNLNSSALTASSSPTITGNWGFNTDTVFNGNISFSESGYFYFENDQSTNIIEMQVNGNDFSMNNVATGNPFLSLTPVSSGTDTLQFGAYTSFNEQVTINNGADITGVATFNDNITCNAAADISYLNISEALQVNGSNLFNGICMQNFTQSIDGNEVQCTVTGWTLDTYSLTCTTPSNTGIVGMLGINMSNSIYPWVSGSFTLNLSGSPLAGITNFMGLNITNIATQATYTDFYVSAITEDSITITTYNNGSFQIGDVTIRLLITN